MPEPYLIDDELEKLKKKTKKTTEVDLFEGIVVPGEGYLTEDEEERVRKATERGWYIDPNAQTYSGQPETIQERDFVANFILEQGRLPTIQEASTWLVRTYGTEEGRIPQEAPLEYTPGSTMYELGYRTQAEFYRAMREARGEPFQGARAGELTPEFGSIVLTDERGNPLFRVAQTSEIAKEYIAKGQYITPPEGKFGVPQGAPRGYMSGEPGTELDVPLPGGRGAYYRKYQPLEEEEFTIPNIDEALSTRIDPRQAYAMRAQDYIDNLVSKDALKVNDIQQELVRQQAAYQRGEIKERDWVALYNARAKELEGLWTKERASTEAERIGIMLKQGASPETLPYYRESQQGEPGAAVKDWYDALTEQLKKEYRESRERQPSMRKPLAAFPIESRGQIAQQKQAAQPAITGTERTDYQTYVKKLGVSYNAQAWLYNQYPELIELWQASGMTIPFMDFVSDYLSGEWQAIYAAIPPGARGERVSRFAPVAVSR